MARPKVDAEAPRPKTRGGRLTESTCRGLLLLLLLVNKAPLALLLFWFFIVLSCCSLCCWFFLYFPYSSSSSSSSLRGRRRRRRRRTSFLPSQGQHRASSLYCPLGQYRSPPKTTPKKAPTTALMRWSSMCRTASTNSCFRRTSHLVRADSKRRTSSSSGGGGGGRGGH